jgi:hypothetical protein
MNRRFIFGFSIVFMLTACANQSTLPTPDQTDKESQSKDVATPVALTETYTRTPLLEEKPTAVDLPIIQTPTAEVVDPMKWRFQDLIEQDQPVEDLELQGSILLQSEYFDDSPSKVYYSQIHIWNLENGDKRVLAPDGLSVGKVLVSPNRNWIAYRISEGSPTIVKDIDAYRQNQKIHPFILEDREGVEFQGISDEIRLSYLVQWPNEDDLIIHRDVEGKDNIFAFNPFDGTMQTLLDDPDNMYLFGWHYTWRLVYDPSLTLRFYINYKNEIAVENMTTREVVGTFPVLGTKPQWMPGGQIFLIPLPEPENNSWDLYSITISGEQRKLVNVASNQSGGKITFIEVSPNGKKVAFWTSKDLYYGHLRLGVVDCVTLDTTIYNLTAAIIGSEIHYVHEPQIVWSPDGTQLLVEGITIEGQQVYLVDLQAGWAVKIAKDMSPIGWLK